MPSLYLTPASISSLNQVLLGGLITGYLLWRLRRPGDQPARPGSILLIGFFGTVMLLTALLFFEASLAPSESLLISYGLNPLLGVVLCWLLAFAYRYPELPRSQVWESWIALAVCVVYAVWEVAYAVWRFTLLRGGEVVYRPAEADPVLVALAVWIVIVFARRRNRMARAFAAIFLILIGIVLSNLLYGFGLISGVQHRLSIATGTLIGMFLFAVTYLSDQMAPTSFIVKLAGGLLTALLVVLGSLAWVVGPAYAAQYQVSLARERALRFTPNSQGGYDVQAVAWSWDAAPGERLPLVEAGAPVAAPFAFPFFDTVATTIWVDDNCALGVGSPVNYASLERNYGNRPAILPLFSNYRPGADPATGVFLRRELNRLTLTCVALPLYYQPDYTVTLQVVLHQSGVFELRYQDLPNVPYRLEDRPQAALWLIGVTPGASGTSPQLVDLTRLPLSSDARGLIHDEYLAERTTLHQLMLPIAWVVLLAGVGLTVGLPIILRRTILRPLNRLLEGVRQAGAHGVYRPIPVQDQDEIGFLTTTFNQMSRELDALIDDLEARVQARTADLSAVNERLSMLSTAIEQSPSSFVITDPDGRIEYVNPAFTHATGYTFAEVRHQRMNIVKSGEVAEETYQSLWSTITSGQIWRGELINKHKDGRLFWEWTVIAPIFGQDRQITHFVTIKEEITARKLAEQSLIESEQRYRDLFNLESDALLIIRNSDGQILEVNQPTSTLYGYTHEELLNMCNADLSAEPEATRKASQSGRPTDEVITIPLRWHRKKDGTVFPVEITARFITWKGIPVHLAAIRDNTERYNTQQALERLATTDPLTGLFNRRYFFERAELFFASADHPQFTVAALMIDIDHFKRFNDTYGHAVGDQVLIQVARRLQEQIRTNDLLARYGGEEFVLLLPRTGCVEACEVAERIWAAIRQVPLDLSLDEPIVVSVSIGVACLDADMPGLSRLLQCADQALYQAKADGRDRWQRYEARAATV